jgi:hypothetical protein
MAKQAGCVWVSGTRLHFIDSTNVERYFVGINSGATVPSGAVVGSVWIDAARIYYLDETRVARYIPAAFMVAQGATAGWGSIWVTTAGDQRYSLRFITNDTNHTEYAAHSDATGTHGDIPASHTDYTGTTVHTDTHEDSAHGDIHSDVAHADTHGDLPEIYEHEDKEYGGGGYFDHADHTDVIQTHTDTYSDSHSDAYTDVYHIDTHGDVPAHTDSAVHGDETVVHEDVASTHADQPVYVGP